MNGRHSKVCRHCGALLVRRDNKGRWLAEHPWSLDPSRFCPRINDVPRTEHAPVPLWNPKKLEAWLDSTPMFGDSPPFL